MHDWASLIKSIVERYNKGTQTELCGLMTRYGSDKSTRHSYTVAYDTLFSELRGSATDVLEIGIGSSRLEFPNNMGTDGKPGASLRAWRDWFSTANIWGCDIDKESFFEESRIQTFYLDQTHFDPSSYLPQQPPQFDVIIDDGLHEPFVNLHVLRSLYPRLKPGGFYIIEDLINRHLVTENLFARWDMNCRLRDRDYEHAFLRLDNRQNKFDNNLFVIRRCVQGN